MRHVNLLRIVALTTSIAALLATPVHGQSMSLGRQHGHQDAGDIRSCCRLGAATLMRARHDAFGSKRLFLSVERGKRRVIATNAHTGISRELRLTGNEQILRIEEGDVLLVVVTSQRFLAFSAFSSSWQVESMVPNERLLDIESDEANAILLTTHRILTFDTHRARWTTRRRS